LDNCSNQDKKDAYTYLSLQVKATHEGADIKGYLDPSVLTTGQTWGYRLCCTYEYPSTEPVVTIIPQARRQDNKQTPQSGIGMLAR